METKEKILPIVACILMIFLAFICYPEVMASFDDVKYDDGEVFKPVNGTYDFKKFSLSCPQTQNYTAKVEVCGLAQLADNCGNHTINVLEWDKMGFPFWLNQNSSISKELEKPNHTVDGIKIIDVDLHPGKVYAASAYDPDTNTLVYLSSPSEKETLEMIKSLEFKDDM